MTLAHRPNAHWLTMRTLLGALGIALLSGCLSVGKPSPAPTYYLLTAHAQPGQSSAADFAIGVGPVHVAPFLARSDIVVHAGSSGMQLNEGERWGEPLEHGIQRVLLQNLHTLTGAETRNFPWRQSGIPRYAVRIDVIDLDRLGDGSAVLEVSWLLEDVTSGTVLKTRQQRLNVALSGTGTPALAEAYSELFTQLAQQIAAALPPNS